MREIDSDTKRDTKIEADAKKQIKMNRDSERVTENVIEK